MFKMDLNEIGWDDVDWSPLTKDRDKLVSFCEHDNASSGPTRATNYLND
jgi:hypothetical protein